MKRKTLLLSLFLWVFAATGQSFEMEPQDYEKLLQIRNAENNAKELVLSMDRAPLSNHQIQPGQVQPAFRDGHIGFAWNIYAGASGLLEGPISLDLVTGAATSIQGVDSELIWMAAGEVADDTWYTVNYHASNASLYTVDPATGDYTLVGATGYSLTGLAYDHDSGIMYASGYDGDNSQLYTLNLDTGAATLVGLINNGIIIGIAADTDGNIYGINLDDNLYSINASTGAGTVVGPLGVTINYAQDIAFDRDNNVLYGALYTTTGGLYTINVTTGTATLINNFVAEVAGFGIPYSTAEDAAPAAVADLIGTAGALGALEVSLSWTNPSTQLNGGVLTELTSVIIERGGVIIETIANPIIGGAETFADDGITGAGMYNYRVYGVNAAGEGPKTAVGLYVGEDVPAAPGNVTLVAGGNNGHLTWTAPATGLNGGYLSGNNLTYTVVRMPGAVEVATDITAVGFTDTAVPGIGNYYYIVTAGNAIGEGGFAASNAALLGAEGILLYETFDYEIGTIPPGWTVEAELDPNGNNQGDGMVNWAVRNFSTAGGTAPQMRFTWTPRFEGMSRLVTGAIDTDGNSELRLRFNQFLSNFAVAGNTLAVKASFDGGDTWTDLWTHNIAGNITAKVTELFIDVPAGKSTMHLAWEFNGDSYQINNWDLDNIILEPVFENDLVALAITGNTTPSEGVEEIYTITVQNAGTVTQSDYTVKLMKEGNVEIASVAGTAIEFGQTLTFDIPWTPAPGETGPTYLYGVVDFAADELPGNNQTAYLNVVVQSVDIFVTTIGTGTNYPNVRMPFDFFWKNSLTQTIYYSEEIGMGGGVITGVQYTNNFSTNLPQKAIKIWIGETELNNLTDGFIDPATLQSAFEGTVDFPAGENTVLINLDNIYIYTGENLVIYTQRVWEDHYYSSLDRFYGTEDPGSSRTRRVAADGTSGLDPMNPTGGATSNWHPNTSLYFSTAGLGALEGTVTDGTDPLEDILVRVLGTMASTHTDATGFYEFPYLLPGTYNVEFSKFGYETTVINDVVIAEDEVTLINLVLNTIPLFTVSGVVEGNDNILQEGAMVSLQGYDDYMVMTGADGSFEIEDVFEGTYTLTVAAEGYEIYVDETVEVVGADLDLGTITVIEIIVPPANLQVDVDGQDEGNALLTWTDIAEREFRYDDGTATGQLGSAGGTLTTVLGSAHRNDAVLQEMSWYLTAEGGPHNTVKVWVFGLDANGQPNPQDVLYEMADVPNTDEQWNTYEFTAPVEAPNGFLIGLSYAGFLGIGTDAGTSTQWPFMPNSNFFVANYTTGQFAAIEGLGDFTYNFLIRALGVDNGEIDFKKDFAYDTTDAQHVTFSKLPEPVETGFPIYSNHNSVSTNKAFVGFNIFLDGEQVATEITDMEYLFTNLDEGTYTAGVQTAHTTGTSPIVTIDFEITFGVPVTFTVNTNSGDSPQGAHVLLTNQDHEQYVYEHTVGPNGVALFPSVRKGMYTLQITLEGFYNYAIEDINIQNSFFYTAILEEIITAPYGLLVETEGLPAGNALLSWNHALADEIFEGFVHAAFREHVADNYNGGTAIMLDNEFYGAQTQRTIPVPIAMTGLHSIVDRNFDYVSPSKSQKEFLGYNIFLNGTELASEIAETEYLFSNLSDGTYTAGVQSVYSSGVSEIMTIDFNVEEISPIITFNVDMTNAPGFNPLLHSVYLTGNFTGWSQPGTEGSILMTRVVKEKTKINFFENFENYGDFTTQLAPWINIDTHGNNTWGSADFDFEGETQPFGWKVMNPGSTSPPITDIHPAHSGSKYLFSVASNPIPPGNEEKKWLISPPLAVTAESNLSFYAKSITHVYGAERMKVYISNGGSEIDDFVMISSAPYLEVPLQWTEYTFSLEAWAGETIRFAVENVSVDAFMLFLDSFSVTHSEESDSLIYTASVAIEEGEAVYKYFSDAYGAGWEGGEWEGDPNRVIEVSQSMTINDTWGIYEGVLHTLNLDVFPPSSGSVSGQGQYLYGEEVTLHAFPNEGYSFNYWTDSQGNIIDYNASFVYSMPASSTTLTAIFGPDDPNQQLVTFHVKDFYNNPVYNAQITVTSQNKSSGSSVQKINPIILYSNAQGVAGFNAFNGEYSYSVEKTGFLSVTSVFTVEDFPITIPVTLLTDPLDYIVTFNLNMIYAPPGFDPDLHNISLTGSFTQWAEPGTEGAIELIHSEGTIFTASIVLQAGVNHYKYFSDAYGEGWWGGEWPGDPNRVIEASQSMTINDIWGVYEGVLHTLNLNVFPPSSGSVSGQGQYPFGEEVTLNAFPNDGYSFNYWTDSQGNIINDNAGFVYSMPAGSTTLTANFGPEDPSQQLVTFHVKDASNNPISNAQITVMAEDKLTHSLNKTNPIILYTNYLGHAGFNANSGEYSFLVEKTGYLDVTGNFSVGNSFVNIPVIMPDDIQVYTVTFNLDMIYAAPGFDPDVHTIYLTGGMNEWIEPGTEGSIELIHLDGTIFTAEMELQTGLYYYKYFSDANGEGWMGGEWAGIHDREFVLQDHMVINDIWGLYYDIFFDLSLQANPAGSGSATGSGQYQAGEIVNLQALASTGFTFLNWTDPEGNIISEAPGFQHTMYAGHHTLTANFTQSGPGQYLLSLEAVPEVGGQVTGSGQYEQGEQVTISAIPSEGYVFHNWRKNGTVIGTQAQMVYTMPAENVTLTAHFYSADNPLFTLTLQHQPQVGGTTEGAGDYLEGEAVEISAVPSEGYEFIRWLEMGTGIVYPDATFTYTMPAQDITLIAYFDLVDFVQNHGEQNLKLFPNPAHNSVTLSGMETITTIEVSDITGKNIYRNNPQSKEIRISVNDWENGIYIIRIYTSNQVILKKLHVQK